MATNTEGKENMSVMDRLIEKSIKTMEKATAQQTESRLQNGQSPEEILKDLINVKTQQMSFSPSKGDVAQAALTILTGIPTSGFSRVANKRKMKSEAEDDFVKLIGVQQQLQQTPMVNLKAETGVLSDLLSMKQKERESSIGYKQQENEMKIKSAITQQEGIAYSKAAAASLGAIDAFDSLKSSFYEGFQPISIEEATGKPISEATINDLFNQKMDSFTKYVNAKLEKNPNASAFLRNVNSFATLISRGGFSEKGTLTDTDRKVVVRAFNLALSNKETADVAWDTIGNVLSKPALRYAKFKITKFGETLEDVELPFGMQEKALSIKELNPDITDKDIINYLINRSNKFKAD